MTYQMSWERNDNSYKYESIQEGGAILDYEDELENDELEFLGFGYETELDNENPIY